MKPARGFTLIEVLAASLLSTIVAGALLSFLHMTNDQIKQGTYDLKLGRLQTVVSEQIRIAAHKACGITIESDYPMSSFSPTLYPQISSAVPHAREVWFCDKGAVPLAKYRINSSMGYLEEWYSGAADYYPFRVGGDTVFVNAGRSEFNIYAGRNGLAFTIAYQSKDGNDTIPTAGENVLCRNSRQ